MSWRTISMKFPGTCMVCKKKIEVNEVALWSHGLGVKHQACATVTELRCMICGGPAGCSNCEFANDCDLARVSQMCVCKKCIDRKGVFASYQASVIKRFPMLNVKEIS